MTVTSKLCIAVVSRSDCKPLDNGGLLKKCSIAIKILLNDPKFTFLCHGCTIETGKSSMMYFRRNHAKHTQFDITVTAPTVNDVKRGLTPKFLHATALIFKGGSLLLFLSTCLPLFLDPPLLCIHDFPC